MACPAEKHPVPEAMDSHPKSRGSYEHPWYLVYLVFGLRLTVRNWVSCGMPLFLYILHAWAFVLSFILALWACRWPLVPRCRLASCGAGLGFRRRSWISPCGEFTGGVIITTSRSSL